LELLDELLDSAHTPALPGRGRRGWMIRRLLLAADLVGLIGAFAVTELAFYDSATRAEGLSTDTQWIVFVCSLPLWIVAIKAYGLYDHDAVSADHSTSDEIASVFHLITVAVWLYFATSWLAGLVDPNQPKLALFWLLAVTFVAGFRVLARIVARRRASYIQNTLIVGAGDVGQVVGRKILNHPEYGLNLIGFVDGAPKERRLDLADLTIIGTPDQLPELVKAFNVERIVVAFSNESHEELLELIRPLNDLDVQIDIVPRLFEIVSPQVEIHSIEGLPVINVPPFRLSRSSRLLKRTIDLAGAGVALALLSPVFALVALMIKLDSRGPVFFRQTRMGEGSKPFRIFKFRTMVVDADARKDEYADLNKHARSGDGRMFKIPDDPRVTQVGRFLRRYSLDELPQLLNVVLGQMSLVGPRPLILDEDQHVGAWGRKRLNLRPGMTGLWQVTGRSEMPFDEMVKLDYVYVTGWSLGGDLKLLARTIPSVFRTKTVY
jgi:exopolysaccharide biosynthesis polyprenyl glycosylphosphotransferase